MLKEKGKTEEKVKGLLAKGGECEWLEFKSASPYVIGMSPTQSFRTQRPESNPVSFD